MTLALSLWASTASAGDWTDLPWMTAEPKQLLEAARKAPPAEESDVRLLLDEIDVQIDKDGRRVRRTRYVFAVLTPRGAEDWGVFGADWASWYEDRPELDARVVTPDGVVHPLDKAHIAESVDPAAD